MAETYHGFNPTTSRGRTKPGNSPGGGLGLTELHGEWRSSCERAFGRLVAELGQAREHERQRIANDLHDQIGQSLVLAMMKLGLLRSAVGKEQKLMVREIHQLISGVIDETRALMWDLHPHALCDLGLKAALEGLMERTRANYGLACVVESNAVPPSLPREITETVFQAVRELLVNVAKHAQAKQARVTFRTEGSRMVIQIADDGKGFEPAQLSPIDPRRGGFGLLSIRERLARLGGSMDIESASGQGTRVTISVPANTEKRA